MTTQGMKNNPGYVHRGLRLDCTVHLSPDCRLSEREETNGSVNSKIQKRFFHDKTSVGLLFVSPLIYQLLLEVYISGWHGTKHLPNGFW